MPDPKQSALENPRAGDRWEKGSATLEIEKWEGTSCITKQEGRMRDMFLCNWDANLSEAFRRWAATADYLGNPDERSADGK